MSAELFLLLALGGGGAWIWWRLRRWGRARRNRDRIAWHRSELERLEAGDDD